MDRFLTTTQLHTLLRDQGHTLRSEDTTAPCVDVQAPPEMIITVALDPDPTLKPIYRDRYFACLWNADEEPLLRYAPAFALRGPFATVAEREPGNNEFVMGPVRWLLARLGRFQRVLLWPKDGFCKDGGPGVLLTVAGGGRTEQVPHLARWFALHAPQPEGVGAALLNLTDLGDCQVLWEAANLVGESDYDIFVSDVAAREVYLMHHHDKVVISIPEGEARRELLEQLARQDGLLEDCSGYSS